MNGKNDQIPRPPPPWFKSIFISSIATTVAEISTIPICTLKTHFVNDEDPVNRSYSRSIRSIYQQQGGFRGFYRASGPAIAAQVLSTTLKYTCYRGLQSSNLIPNHGIIGNMINGSLVGIGVSLITHPIDVIRVHYQMDKKFPETKILYRGISKSLSKGIIGSSLFFPLYDLFKNEIFPGSQTIASFSSAVTSTLIMHPLDYLKVRHIYGQSLYDSKWNILKYYRGVGLSLARIVPHFMIVMNTIEFIDKIMMVKTK